MESRNESPQEEITQDKIEKTNEAMMVNNDSNILVQSERTKYDQPYEKMPHLQDEGNY